MKNMGDLKGAIITGCFKRLLHLKLTFNMCKSLSDSVKLGCWITRNEILMIIQITLWELNINILNMINSWMTIQHKQSDKFKLI